MNLDISIPKGINMNDLHELAKSSPKHAQLLLGLSQIDASVKRQARETIEAKANEPGDYYIKTELFNHCYNMYLYNKSVNATVGTTWTLTDLLTQCSNKTMLWSVESITLKAIEKLGEKKLKSTKTYWI